MTLFFHRAHKKKQEVGKCFLQDASSSQSLLESGTTYQLLFWTLISYKIKAPGLGRGFKPSQSQDPNKDSLLLQKGRNKSLWPRGRSRKITGPRLWHQHRTEICSTEKVLNYQRPGIKLSNGGTGMLQRPIIRGPVPGLHNIKVH